MYKSTELSTPIIAICFFAWPLIIPLIIGIYLLILQNKENKFLIKKYGEYDKVDSNIKERKHRLNDLNDKITKQQEKLSEQQGKLNDLQEEVNDQITKNLLASLDFTSFESLTSTECKNELALLKQQEKELIKTGDALNISDSYGDTKKKINDNSKQILRCFNAECDNIILLTSVKNIDSLRAKITKSYEMLNKIFAVDNVQLTQNILELKLSELTLVYLAAVKHEEEKEIQKEIKAQMIEEEKVRKELEKKRLQLEKDEKQFQNEISKMMKYMQKADNDIEKKIYADKINVLNEKIQKLENEKEDIINRQENAKAGFVYIISNIGSFGNNVYKIGMTRRLEPMDRIKELSSASVPFEFDVHAMIFSENAPDLESKLHQHFDSKRVNKINPRKEFFKITIDEIEDFVDQNFDKTVSFTKIPVAKEYNASLALTNQDI